MICAPSIGEEQAARFEKVYYAVRFISNEAKYLTQTMKEHSSLIGHHWT